MPRSEGTGFLPGLNVYRSNSLLRLVDDLAGVLKAEPVDDPVLPERIVVGSRGMESWLSRQLAQRMEVCANLSFSFPVGMLDRMTLLLDGADPEEAWGGESLPPDPWSADSLVWGVLSCLTDLRAGAGPDPAFEQILDYLEEGKKDKEDEADKGGKERPISRRWYTLARRMADVLDRYTLHRPELACGWSGADVPMGDFVQPGDLAWQPLLWADLQNRYSEARPHLALRALEATEQAKKQAKKQGGKRKKEQAQEPARDRDAGLPGLPRLTIFSISSLPPLMLDCFAAMARLVQVNLFLPCPSREYWADLRSVREEMVRRRMAAKKDRKQAIGVRSMTREELTSQLRERAWQKDSQRGNPMLAACGRIARDFQVVLEDVQYEDATDEALAFVEPVPTPDDPAGPRASALNWLQSDMLAARHPVEHMRKFDSSARRALDPADDSIQLHACHGPTRQVEVLRELLLGLLSDHLHLEPRDVLVMTPDIEAFAPLISSVFDGGRDRELADGTYGSEGAPRIPYRIEDLTLRRTNPVADALLRTMELAQRRVEASSVLELLELDPVRRRFGLDADDLSRIQGWIMDSGVRWGLDADHRTREQQPHDDGNTWAFGLDRLALGVCLAAEDRLVGGVMPVADLEGGETALLGRFFDFINTLQRELGELGDKEIPRSVQQWADRLAETVAALTRTSAKAGWLTRQVTDALSEMKEQAGAAGLTHPVDLPAMEVYLDGRFEVPSGKKTNPRGAVTFCGMMPMRSIPYRVICMLGMDEGAFPRKVVPVGFDLTARQSRLGDRDPRDEDRLIFLEALQSAGEHLLLLYTGRDVRTGEERDPAVVVDELRDLMNISFPPMVRDGIEVKTSKAMTTEHPLQAFSPDNFTRKHSRPPGGTGEEPKRPWSFHTGLLEASGQLQKIRHGECQAEEYCFFPAAKPGDGTTAPAEASPAVVSLDELIAFFKQPVKHLLNRGLNLYLKEQDDLVEDRESIALDGLQQWVVASELLRAGQGGPVMEATGEIIRAQGRLPLGNPGRFVLEERQELAQRILERYHKLRGDQKTDDPLPVALDIGAQRLIGALGDRYGARSLSVDVGKVKGKRLVGPWIRCLAWSAQHPEQEPAVQLVLGARDNNSGEVEVEALEFCLRDMSADEREAYARQRLGELIRLYRRGLDAPLPLFEASSYAFAETVDEKLSASDFAGGHPDKLETAAKKALDAATKAALKVWEPATYAGGFPGESEDPHMEHVYGHEHPIVFKEGDQAGQVRPEFGRLALLFWQPLLATQETLTDNAEEANS